MDYAGVVAQSARRTVRNPVAVVLVSVATTLSLLPFLSGLLLAGTAGGLVGLWTSCILLGFVATGGARISTILLERNVSLGTDYFWAGVKRGSVMGPVVGVGNFLAIVLLLLASSVRVGGILRYSILLVGLYLCIAWFTLATFSLTMWARRDSPSEVRSSFRDGGLLLLAKPRAGLWVVIQAIGWTLLAIPLILAPVLLLPGFVQLVSTAIVRTAYDQSSFDFEP